MAKYQQVRAAAIGLIDDFSPKDVVAGYGSTYTPKTKLAGSLGLSDPARAVMPVRTNKVMLPLVGVTWTDVGPLDTVACQTIGDFILLLCRKSKTLVPGGIVS